ncbi:hypothetical protein GSB9_02692 [Flavobacteriaceae bacterium GSB9]|nr:hypothetical protein GSB9_02692 [Flavobacteriaceae bacterium GSB9]
MGDLEINATGELRKCALFIDDNSPIITRTVKSLTTAQNTFLYISIEDLVIEDPNNVYPNDFELTVLGGENYSISNNTIIPDPDFIGELTVNLVVNDGQGNSEPFQIKVEVTEPLKIEDEFLKNNFKVFPNPIDVKFTIKAKNQIDTFDINPV